jgi:hypothetical protein
MHAAERQACIDELIQKIVAMSARTGRDARLTTKYEGAL